MRERDNSRRSGAHARMIETIAHEAAKFIAQEAGSESMITVMRAERMGAKRMAVFVSIFPEDKIRSALAFLERKREDFSDHLKAHARLRRNALPRIDFLLDNRVDHSEN